MVTPYTKSAALQLLPFATHVEAVRELKNCIQCTYHVRGGRRCSTFLSKKAFIAHQSQIRVEGAKTIEVTEVRGNGEYVTYSTKSNTYYVVRPDHDDPRQRCECGDCHYRGTKCKHQITVEEFKLQSLSLSLAPALTRENPVQFVTTSTPTDQDASATWTALRTDVTKEIAFTNGFGWMPLSRVDLNPIEKYYGRQRVQIWKLASKYWGTYGHFWIVDSSLGVVVAVVQSNGNGCYDSAYVKREKYLNLLASI